MASYWTKLRARVNQVVQPQLYTAYRIGESELVGQTTKSADELRSFLRQRGYVPQRLSAAKARPTAEQPYEGNDLHIISYRRVPDEHPDEWTINEWGPEQCQYHVHAFSYEDGHRVYSHYELRPFPIPVANESARTAARRAYTHYRPERNKNYLEGVTDLEL